MIRVSKSFSGFRDSVEAGSPLTGRRVGDLDWGSGHGARKMMTEYRYSSNKTKD